jgi:hypothetical protein
MVGETCGVTNPTDAETGVFLLVKKCMNDGLYAQI